MNNYTPSRRRQLFDYLPTGCRQFTGVTLAVLLMLQVGCGRQEEAAPQVAAPTQGQSDAPAPAPSPESGVPVAAEQIAALFEQLGGESPIAAGQVPDVAGLARTDPNWPTFVYLIGEAHRQRGERDQARAAFRELATWAATTDSGSGPDAARSRHDWGGSGLAAVALWRWLQLFDSGEGPEVDQLLAVANRLQGTRLFAGMVRSGLLPALPLLEEDVARRLAHVASRLGRPEAMSLFLDFISINSSGELDATDRQIIAGMIERKLVNADRLELFRYRRQLGQVKTQAQKEVAAEQLRQLWQKSSAPAEVRAEAGYEWGNYHRRSRQRKPEVVAALTSAYELSGGTGSVAEKALYRRAMVQGSVAPERRDIFFADMAQLLARHPDSRLADDALYQVASEQLLGIPANPDEAFGSFEKLRAFDGTNDWQDSAYFLAAMGHLDRGSDADLAAADRLLADYVERHPDGVFRQRSLFWRGRIAERRQDKTAAELFTQAVDVAPYSYHGLRAALHLEAGSKAMHLAMPPTGSQTFLRLRAAYRGAQAAVELSGASAYHARLQAAADNGVYARVLAIIDGIGPRFRNRLDGIALEELDEHRLVPAAALLLSLRQDALAARDAQPTVDNQLRLAGFLGQQLLDWPTAMMIVAIDSGDSSASRAELQKDPRYLSTAYPSAAALARLSDSLAAAAWPIDGSTAVSQSLMYAVIRRESAYFPGAISPVGALGLFQVMPLTFENRKDCWQGLPAGRPTTPASYLFNPARNVQFWSCWVRKEFAPASREEIAEMLIRHHAGTGHLNEWRRMWQGRAIADDLELQIETLRFPATQIFVRQVLTDTAIADAAGLFEPGAEGERP